MATGTVNAAGACACTVIYQPMMGMGGMSTLQTVASPTVAIVPPAAATAGAAAAGGDGRNAESGTAVGAQGLDATTTAIGVPSPSGTGQLDADDGLGNFGGQVGVAPNNGAGAGSGVSTTEAALGVSTTATPMTVMASGPEPTATAGGAGSAGGDAGAGNAAGGFQGNPGIIVDTSTVAAAFATPTNPASGSGEPSTVGSGGGGSGSGSGPGTSGLTGELSDDGIGEFGGMLSSVTNGAAGPGPTGSADTVSGAKAPFANSTMSMPSLTGTAVGASATLDIVTDTNTALAGIGAFGGVVGFVVNLDGGNPTGIPTTTTMAAPVIAETAAAVTASASETSLPPPSPSAAIVSPTILPPDAQTTTVPADTAPSRPAVPAAPGALTTTVAAADASPTATFESVATTELSTALPPSTPSTPLPESPPEATPVQPGGSGATAGATTTKAPAVTPPAQVDPSSPSAPFDIRSFSLASEISVPLAVGR